MLARMLVLAILLAGCSAQGPENATMGDTGPQLPSTTTPPPPPSTTVPPSPAPVPAPTVPGWGSWTFRASGGPGEWTLAFQPVPAGTAITEFMATVEATATGPLGSPLGLLVFAPQLTTAGPNGTRISDEAHLRFRVNPLGGEVSWSDAYQAAQIEGPVPGFFVAVASNGDWELTATVDLGAGPPAAGTFVHRGQDAAFAFAAPPTPVSGTVVLEADVAKPGWTHLMVPVASCPHSGSRSYDVRLPDGTAESSQDVAVMLYDFIGTLSDPVGTVHASIDYTETGLGAGLAYMHMPATAASFPNGFDLAGYRRVAGQPTCE